MPITITLEDDEIAWITYAIAQRMIALKKEADAGKGTGDTICEMQTFNKFLKKVRDGLKGIKIEVG